eukprot:CAMPEP_0185017968 /NCGR_PEP_ID=MMETSP1103-20130426/820_1 /TAXON_ID=36769 /ORGANISM="Paraphysomonas bandaiensis, Strain Caron Lab Isolate" /LENGTH=438 /DNA_ID=CAMNT_0027547599 /DNA_START=60 /DNA_END=1377 /DNA_ORIENTATION=-
MSLLDGMLDALLKSCFTGDDTKSAADEPTKNRQSKNVNTFFEIDKTESESSTSQSSASSYKANSNGISHRGTTYAISVADFEVHNTLITGRFGCTLLAAHSSTGKTVALNTYHKAILSETCQQHAPCREKQLLESLDHPFITKVLGSFSDRNNLFLITDVEPGASLTYLLCNSTKYGISNSHKVFYAACVLSALKYAHEKSVVHRGLHPDFLLIDSRGYLKVTDWGFAKTVTDRTFTLCGHVEYLCPEAISQDSGYGKGADYWALGVLIFEMLVGRSAFVPYIEGVEDSSTQQSYDATTIENIVSRDIVFPNDMSQPSKSIIQGLCQKNPTQRLGCVRGGRGAEDIQNHVWFSQGGRIDWKMLESRQLSPPWVPKVSSPLDCRYYNTHSAPPSAGEIPEYPDIIASNGTPLTTLAYLYDSSENSHINTSFLNLEFGSK